MQTSPSISPPVKKRKLAATLQHIVPGTQEVEEYIGEHTTLHKFGDVNKKNYESEHGEEKCHSPGFGIHHTTSHVLEADHVKEKQGCSEHNSNLRTYSNVHAIDTGNKYSHNTLTWCIEKDSSNIQKCKANLSEISTISYSKCTRNTCTNCCQCLHECSGSFSTPETYTLTNLFQNNVNLTNMGNRSCIPHPCGGHCILGEGSMPRSCQASDTFFFGDTVEAGEKEHQGLLAPLVQWDSSLFMCDKPLDDMENDDTTCSSASGPVMCLKKSEPQSCCSIIKEPPEVNGPSSEDHQEFDEVISKFLREQGIPGASIAVARKGTIIYTQTYGWARQGERVRPDHRFRIASITKSLTATGIMRLYEEGKLHLTDKVFGPKGILSEFSPTEDGDRRLFRITIRHLLQHSAGWDREEVGDPVFWRHIGAAMGVPEPINQTTLIKYMMTQKVQFSPGLKHVYSNLGYVVLGQVIEKITGQKYGDYIQGLLAKVGITHIKLGRTKKEDTEEDEVDYISCPKFSLVESVYPGEGKVPAPYGGFAMEYGQSDGGWIATATDLVRFFSAMDGTNKEKLLKPQTFKLMLSKPPYIKGTSAWYGFGLDVSWYRKAWEHSGTLDGATSSLVHDRNGYVYAFLCNFWPPDTDYTSLVSYAMTRVPKWCKVKKVDVPLADGATLDEKYLIKVQIPSEKLEWYLEMFKNKGYQVQWLTAYKFRGRTFFNGIWCREISKSICLHKVNLEDLDATVAKKVENQYSLTHIDMYVDNKNTLKYILIFVPQREESQTWSFYHGLSILELEEKIQAEKEKGYFITCQPIVCYQGELEIAALFKKVETKGCWAACIFAEKYQSNFDRHVRYGHLPVYAKAYRKDKELKFSTIWTSPGPYQYTSEYEMSKLRLLNDFLIAAENSFHPICISGYEDENIHKYVAICVKEVPPKSV